MDIKISIIRIITSVTSMLVGYLMGSGKMDEIIDHLLKGKKEI